MSKHKLDLRKITDQERELFAGRGRCSTCGLEVDQLYGWLFDCTRNTATCPVCRIAELEAKLAPANRLADAVTARRKADHDLAMVDVRLGSKLDEAGKAEREALAAYRNTPDTNSPDGQKE